MPQVGSERGAGAGGAGGRPLGTGVPYVPTGERLRDNYPVLVGRREGEDGEGERGATPSVRGRGRDPRVMDKVNDWFARLQPPDVPGDVP